MSKGNALIQEGLNSLGYIGRNGKPLATDGLFGPNTEHAAREWLTNDGRPRLDRPQKDDEAAPPVLTGWDDRSKRNLQGVHSDLIRVMDLARSRSPIRFTVIEGLRSVDRQRQLVAQGASKTMNSRHITGHAVDIVPHRPDGTMAFDWPLYHKVAPIIKDAARELGIAITWGGDWVSFKDGPHFELARSAYPA